VALSTFSGCGGACLGYRMAGFEIGVASEFVPEARETYRANFPGTPVDPSDIREISGGHLLRIASDRIGRKLDVGDADLLEGSPPCSDFSTAGKRNSGWGKTKDYSSTRQRVDDLFFEFARIVGDIQPKLIVAENVPGLARGVSKGYFKEIHAALAEKGYRVKAAILDASWLGVPQARKRLFFFGVRNDLDAEPVFPKPRPYQYTIRDALPWIDAVSKGAGTYGYDYRENPEQDSDRPSPTIQAQTTHQLYAKVSGRTGPQFERTESELDEPMNTIIQSDPTRTRYLLEQTGLPPGWFEMPDEERGVSLEGYAVGREWDTLRVGETSDRYFQLVKPHADEPAPTVTQLAGSNPGVAGLTHPFEKRKFSIPELRRLCGFPDDFALTGTYSQRWERLGRAVPPPVTEAIGREAKKILDRLSSTA
jgi:DNA (cytosine-5)-methyltransferase 1